MLKMKKLGATVDDELDAFVERYARKKQINKEDVLIVAIIRLKESEEGQ